MVHGLMGTISRFAQRRSLIVVLFFFMVTGCRGPEDSAPPADNVVVDEQCPPVEVAYADPATIVGDYSESRGIKDFCLIKAGETIHLFHITDPGLSWQRGGEISFGHATSKDLVNWTTLDRIENLRTDPNKPESWSKSCVWAPHIIEHDGTYYMFYTGVEWSRRSIWKDHWQRIGLATSTDLSHWTRYNDQGEDGLVLDGPDSNEFPWSVYSAGKGTHDCRDPFVYDNGSEYVMFVATKAKNSSNKTALVIAYATSTDLVEWEWGNIIEATWPTRPHFKAESPNLVQANGTYYLMWTYKSDALPQGGAVKIAYSDDIFGPYTVIEPATPLFGIANETLIEPKRIIYAAFDDVFLLHFKKNLELPGAPAGDSAITIRNFTSCDPEIDVQQEPGAQTGPQQ